MDNQQHEDYFYSLLFLVTLTGDYFFSLFAMLIKARVPAFWNISLMLKFSRALA